MMRHLPIRRPGLVLLAACLSLFAVAGVVDAHAELEDATPNKNAEVEGTPPVISGVYSEPMDPDGSSLKLVDAGDTVIATGGVAPDDDKLMVIDPVPELAPGDYVVQSTTKSAADGDIDRTTWRFTVVAAATPEPTASPSPTATPTAAPTPAQSRRQRGPDVPAPPPTPPASPATSAAPSGDGGTPTSGGSDVLLPILAAVVILVVIGGVLYRRRDRSTPTPP